MKQITEQYAIKLLKKHSNSTKDFNAVLNHSKTVQKLALKLAKNHKCDIQLIKTASLLHDIGRFKHPKGSNIIRHGINGAKILRIEHLPKHALVAERHLGAGISKSDIKEQKLNLPLKDYIPKTIEQKIISHADNRVFNTTIKSTKAAIERFTKELGKKTGLKVKRLAKEVEGK